LFHKLYFMPSTKSINPSSKLNNDTGFSNTGVINGARFINRDGSFNLKKTGWPVWNRYSVYYELIRLPFLKFMLVILVSFIVLNFIFAGIYWMLGADQLNGLSATTSWAKFKELFFFSTQTFTTVGYGRINPRGDGANFVASFEAMTGFLSFAIATGLIYGRFARPRAHLAFSDFAVIAPYRDGNALMFRFACFKEQHALSDVAVQVNLAMLIPEDGNVNYKYYELKLERSKIESLPMNWTVVHPIDEHSPLLGLSLEDIVAADVELYVLVRGFNDIYSSTVLQRTSYTHQEMRMNEKFIPMYRETEQGTILELHKLSKANAI
jgi:inward rectifier potassium channel